jgi:hypothetical protein
VSGCGRKPSPLVGLLLSREAPPGAPPMNSLPPRLWPWMGFAGVDAMVGDCGGDAVVLWPEGLKLNEGRALTDFCRW